MYKLMLLLFCSLCLFGFQEELSARNYTEGRQKSAIQQKAWVVLQQKCNDCHAKKNRAAVFSEKNMNSMARTIHEQVFVKKRMPKGKVKLTEAELQNLSDWLRSLGL